MIYDSREDLIAALFSMRDERYAAFQAPLIPDIPPESIIGVRTPLLRKTAKALIKEGKAGIVLNELPHRYFDENQLHAFIISEEKDFLNETNCIGTSKHPNYEIVKVYGIGDWLYFINPETLNLIS